MVGQANLVLGQNDFSVIDVNQCTVARINKGRGVAVDRKNGRVFSADTFNSRVIWWNSLAGFASGKSADGVLGQDVFVSSRANRGGDAGANTLAFPQSVWVDPSGNVWVADTDNNRVLRFSGALTNGMNADLVLGQANLTSDGNNVPAANTLSRPVGVAVDAAGNVWVADSDNHRVLRFSAPLTSGMNADLVLGQPDFATADNHDANSDSRAEVITAATLYSPQGVTVDQAGNVWVADHLNHRFLRYSPPFSNGMNANQVLGQVDFTSGGSNRSQWPNAATIHCAFSVSADQSGNVWVADFSNNRVLRYKSPLSNGMDAAQVLGQVDFAATTVNRTGISDSHDGDMQVIGSPGPDTLFRPTNVVTDTAGDLWVADSGNHRIMKFNGLKILSLDTSNVSNVVTREIVVRGEGFVPGVSGELQTDFPSGRMRYPKPGTVFQDALHESEIHDVILDIEDVAIFRR
jgi:sugar lactone lactonase YvrE